MLSLAEARKADLVSQGYPAARVYGGDELGGLGVVYVLAEKASVYGLPDDPKLPHRQILGKWMLGVIPGVAILFAMWQRLRKNAGAVEAKTGGE